MPSASKPATRFSRYARLLKQSLSDMRKKDPLRMAGATAFFTTFALPPILIILFQLLTLFLSRRMVGSELRELLTNTLGAESAEQIRLTTRGFRRLVSNPWQAAGGFLFLLFVATTLFNVIKNTLNDLWNIGVREKPGFRFVAFTRIRSIAAILLTGILFGAGILIDSFEIMGSSYIDRVWPGGGIYFSGILNEVVGVAICTVWFAVLFRYLADARPSWKVALRGGFLTGLLFTAGKTLLAFLMKSSNIGTIYGASGSLVLLLLFVFYTSFILYFGASFINVYSEEIKQPLRPVEKAYRYTTSQMEKPEN